MTKVKAVMCHFRCWRAGTGLQGCPLCQTHSHICSELSRRLFSLPAASVFVQRSPALAAVSAFRAPSGTQQQGATAFVSRVMI